MPEFDQHERFLRLFAKSEERIRRYIMVLVPHRPDVDDIYQETTVALWRKFDEYDPSQPFLNWAIRFAHMQVLSHRKKEAVRKKHLQFSDAAIEALSEEPQPTEEELDGWNDALAKCVEALPRRQRELIQLRYGSSATVADLARQLGRAAKPLYKALAQIRCQLSRCVQRRLAMEAGHE